ncbi:MAG: histidinol-phosphate transaminase [Pseudomonadota bacterium]
MSLYDLAPEYIRAIAPYQPGKPIAELAREFGLDEADIIKLASNENPLGASPLALEAIRRAAADMARYPDGNGFELKAAIAKRYGVVHEQIVLGNGSNDVLELAARAFLTPGTAAVYAQYAFAVYPLVTQACGAYGVEVAAQHFGHDLPAMRQAVTRETRIVFIANPNNPTGTLLAADEVLAFLRALPGDVLAVLDEAYNEYLAPELQCDSVAWLSEFPNLIVTRTFSKAYGLAGLRIGFALAHRDVANVMNRVRQPFNVNSLAQAAALAALADTDFVRRSYELNCAGMRQITDGFDRMGLDYIPSRGNFVCFRAGNAAEVYRRLLEQGVIVRPIANYGMPQHLRVSIGLESENERFLDSLALALKEAA